MYKRHKWLIAAIFVAVFIVAAFLKADYSEIAESSISVMAIAIAVYIGATSVILGSAYAEKMKSQVDPEIRTSSSLGVLASYLRTAGAFGIGTIVISTMYSLGIDNQQLMNVPFISESEKEDTMLGRKTVIGVSLIMLWFRSVNAWQ